MTVTMNNNTSPITQQAQSILAEPKPLPENKHDVMPLDSRLLPNKLKAYVDEMAKIIQCPPDFVAVSALCIFASILGNKAAIQPKSEDDTYLVYPALWGALIGIPSVKKSPPFKHALQPIVEIERSLYKDYKTECKQYMTDYEVYESEIKQAKKDCKKDPGKLKAKLKEINNNEPKKPILRRLTINNCTVEKLQELMRDNPYGFLYFRDELSGLLLSLSKEEKAEDRTFLIECFNGNHRFACDRIIRGTTIVDNGIISIVGTIQPSILHKMLQPAINGEREDGFFQRFQLMVYPKPVEQFYCNEAPNKAVIQDYEKLLKTFYELKPINKPGEIKSTEKDEIVLTKVDASKHKIFTFESKAQEEFANWYNAHCEEKKQHEDNPAYQAHLGKMEKTLVTIALIFELIKTEGEAEEISHDSLSKACGFIDYLKSHAKVLYSAHDVRGIANAKTLLKRHADLSIVFTAREIYSERKFTGFNKVNTHEAIEMLIDYGWVYVVYETPSGRGRKTTKYQFHHETKKFLTS